LEENGKNIHSEFNHRALLTLRSRLGASAQKLLRHNWDNSQLQSSWKSKVRPSMLCFLAHILLLIILGMIRNDLATFAVCLFACIEVLNLLIAGRNGTESIAHLLGK
jgi:hypothetical protein